VKEMVVPKQPVLVLEVRLTDEVAVDVTVSVMPLEVAGLPVTHKVPLPPACMIALMTSPLLGTYVILTPERVVKTLLTTQEYVGEVPPLIPAAVNITGVPWQLFEEDEEIPTEAVSKSPQSAVAGLLITVPHRPLTVTI
jgi:hypothetical protein